MKIDRLIITKEDITKLEVDAIVNAANSRLLGGGGVDGVIHRAAGPKLLDECKTLGGCPTGSARITKGYNLPAKYVIHAVGPVWRGGDSKEAELLKSCYLTSLNKAHQYNLETIAFSNISTGIYGFPKAEAATIAVSIVKEFLEDNELPKVVNFVCFDEENYRLYEKLIGT